jgi:DNA-binding response OmpR family regulator
MLILGSTTSNPLSSRQSLPEDQKKYDDVRRERVLFVDDERALREMVPLILTNAGFSVIAAATVSEALSLINSQPFDLLISDLNIGEPGDGFTVVSAMRRSQPDCKTMIFTGYPDFDTALDSIRQQADGFMVKPAHPERLIEMVRQRLAQPRQYLRHPRERLASLLRTNKLRLIQKWLEEVQNDDLLRRVEMSESQRLDHIPVLLDELIHLLESRVGHETLLGRRDLHVMLDEIQELTVQSADQHGSTRKRQGYDLAMLFRESRLAQAVIFYMLHEHLLELEMSSVIPDVTIMVDVFEVLVARSVETFSEAKAA